MNATIHYLCIVFSMLSINLKKKSILDFPLFIALSDQKHDKRRSETTLVNGNEVINGCWFPPPLIEEAYTSQLPTYSLY